MELTRDTSVTLADSAVYQAGGRTPNRPTAWLLPEVHLENKDWGTAPTDKKTLHTQLFHDMVALVLNHGITDMVTEQRRNYDIVRSLRTMYRSKGKRRKLATKDTPIDGFPVNDFVRKFALAAVDTQRMDTQNRIDRLIEDDLPGQVPAFRLMEIIMKDNAPMTTCGAEDPQHNNQRNIRLNHRIRLNHELQTGQMRIRSRMTGETKPLKAWQQLAHQGDKQAKQTLLEALSHSQAHIIGPIENDLGISNISIARAHNNVQRDTMIVCGAAHTLNLTAQLLPTSNVNIVRNNTLDLISNRNPAMQAMGIDPLASDQFERINRWLFLRGTGIDGM